MRPAQQLRLIDRFYGDMWNRFDKTVFADILHPDIEFRGSLGQTKVGFDELADYVDYIEAFAPDFHNEVVTTITEGNRTFARLSYTGTHRGEVFGIAPTGRRFEYAGAAIFTFADGLIREVWVLGDIHGLIGQLSIRKPAAFKYPSDCVRSESGAPVRVIHSENARKAQNVVINAEGGAHRQARISGRRLNVDALEWSLAADLAVQD